MNRFSRFSLSLLAILFSLTSPVVAQQNAQGIISTEATVDFDPSQIVLLVEYPKGMVRFVGGTFSPQPLSASPLTTERTYLVAARVTLATVADVNLFDFAFLLIDEEGSQIKITPVQRQNIAQLRKSTKSLEELRSEIGELETKLSNESGEKTPKTAELVALRDELAEMAELPQLVALRLGIQQKQAELEQRENDIRALRTLVQSARIQDRGDSFSELRAELSNNLRDIAATTAKTERLQRRKVQTAEETLKNKLQLIRETEGVNLQALATEVLELRRQRRALELQLGVAEEGKRSDDF